MNEETIIEKRPVNNGQEENKKEGGSWKHVTLGGVSGILMGAGLLYAGQTIATPKTEAPEEYADAVTAEREQTEQQAATNQTLPVAQMHNDISFGEAFAAARAEVGPGGVFIWHGGIYNTYTAEEWNNMTPAQKNDFAHQVNPEIHVQDIPTPSDTHPDISIHPASDDVQVVEVEATDATAQDNDVHIIGYGEVEGHLAVGYDTDGDGQADVAIIDVDDSGDLSDPDVIIDDQGNIATVEDIANAQDPNQLVSLENPDVAPDMPDYMNDANIDDMNMLA